MTERLHFHFSLLCTGEGNGNLLQCSCLENPRDGGAWWATVCGVAQSWTRLKWLSSSSILFKWRRACQPTPIFLPGKSHGQRNLVGYSPWGCQELDTTEQLHFLSFTFVSLSNICFLYFSQFCALFFQFLDSVFCRESILNFHKTTTFNCFFHGLCFWCYI